MVYMTVHLVLLWIFIQKLTLAAERSVTRERFKVVFGPLICKRTCLKGQCRDTCEQGNNTTLIGENGHSGDTLTGPGFRVVVCPLPCMNGGQCTSRSHCLCPPEFTGRYCQHPLGRQSQSSRSQTQSTGEQTAIQPQTSMMNIRIMHYPESSIRHIEDLEAGKGKNQKLHLQTHKPHPSGQPHLPPQTQKPRGRCFQETVPKQACSSNPLPVLTNQEDCCGSVGNSWGQSKCHKCPPLHHIGVQKTGTFISETGANCPQGYKRLNSTHCQDINECTMQGVCQNGECLNTQGSFRCACKQGYILEHTRCIAEPPEEKGPCYRVVSPEGECDHALSGELTKKICCCSVGKAWGHNCDRCPSEGTDAFKEICPAGKGYLLHKNIEILTNERPHMPHPFPPKQYPEGDDTSEEEKPTKHSTTTTMGPRYPELIPRPTTPVVIRLPPEHHTKSPQEIPPTKGSDTDECRLNRNICGHGECINGQGGYYCHCNTGYHPHSQRKYCVDINECDADPCGSGRGLCLNTGGSYTCHCNSGYQLQTINGAPTCVDINECDKHKMCGEGGHCVNLPGYYKCECYSGYKSKSHRQNVCEDIDECLDPNICPNERCENRPGSYECIPCPPGYHGQGGICYDTDECQNRGLCPNGRCENLLGSYRCLCNEGFVPESNSKICTDLNECEDDRLCANGRCRNTEGSFHCQCFPGYQPTHEGSHCEDTDECADPSNCIEGTCINTMGSYMCKCVEGFQLVNGRRCQDIDECAQDHSLCHPNGVCENIDGSYICLCYEGYAISEDKHSCEEIEIDTDDKKECYLNLDDTIFCDSVLATNITKQECCCSIGAGWGDHCEIYPCPVYNSAEFHSLCPTGRGFYDEMITGYGIPAHRDIDECELFSEEICKDGRCMNTQPGYECYCQQGFYYDSNLLRCMDVDECNDESSCQNGRCVNTPGSFYCICNLPWTADSSKKKCIIPLTVDVDECQDPSNCKNGHCNNTPGSYYCTCTLPWTLATDRNSCIPPEEQGDVDECQDLAYCKNGLCVNTPGSFHCTCNQPYTFSAALKQCVYDDRTAAHRDICFRYVGEDHMCNTPRNSQALTYSECCCHYGMGWGPECRTCPPRNSEMFNRLCDLYLDTDSYGETESLSFADYNNEGDSSEEDSDECNCQNGQCVRSYLGITCECFTGFRPDHTRTRCIDIDECAEQSQRASLCKNAHCINTIGSYKCLCKPGYVKLRWPPVCSRSRTQ
ncbi:latent-transforming growth factor beta-binding protein 3 isoform X1 [Polypterus senegalus]|uniref:latent-transforming growth factor beta-binding protein 3 isoform X1 n=1 Tax=Polypterus senegalus TaxID=55291 RepID=UPI0019647E72|nr:latent-transforming growth factor beta-binding protein 3 isoform X1 [Polypterus senegalus]